MPNTVVIKIQDNFIWFNPNEKIELLATNLPDRLFKFSSRPMYWNLQMYQFDKKTKNLFVSILNYDSNDVVTWQSQSPKSKIKKLTIQNIDWESFSKCLSYYDGQLKVTLQSLLNQENPTLSLDRRPVTILHRLSINKMKIGSGCLTYTKKVRWSSEPQTFTIEHPLMIPQMELIKPYFHNIMGGKMIDVEVSVLHQGAHVEILKTHAPQLQKINNSSLYIMRGLQIKDWVKMQKQHYHKNILQEEIDLSFDPSEIGNVDSIERELLNRILMESGVRNKLQLQYLSDGTSPTDRLMLTVQPQFGFIFTIRGDEMVHCIWELVDSHATYIWSFPHAMQSNRYFKILRREFAKITELGRQVYRDSYDSNNDYYLRTINHGNSNDPLVDRFGQWRIKVEGCLV